VALAVAVMAGGLVLLAAGPAAACSCAIPGSDAKRAARADAVFVGELVGTTVDPLTWGREAWGRPYLPPAVYIFEVSRVYKGAVSQRQEIVTPAHTGPEALVFIAPLGGPLRPHTWVKGF
jgi:integrase